MSRQILQRVALASLTTILAGTVAKAADTQTQQSADTWRASKLVGVSIYGPDNKDVGKIDDIIVGKDGKAQLVVIGVGGFLGMGQKDVAVPYEQVKFSDEPVKAQPPATGTTNGSPAPSGPNAVASDSTTKPMAAGGGSSAKPGAYPDHGSIDMTYDQLKNAPDFKFAS